MTNDLNRRQFLGAAGAGLTASMLPVGTVRLRSDDRLTPLAEAFVRSRARIANPLSTFDPDVRQYAGHPSWYLKLDEESDIDALEDWGSGEGDRRVIRTTPEAPSATIATPVAELETLLDEGYVQWADLNVTAELVDPERLPVAEAEFPEFSTAQQMFMRDSGAPTDGLAFDADPVDLETARETVRDDAFTTGDDRTLAVIDTGLAYDSDMFGHEVDGSTEPRVLDASTDFTADGDPTVGEGGLDAVDDGNGHGTHVTATAASGDAEPNRGVAPDADLLVLRALDDEGSGAMADIAAAVQLAVEEGADAICMSLGAPLYSEAISDAIESAVDEGIAVVVASGNDRYATRFANYPASHPSTIAVSATNVPEDDPAEIPSVESAAFANVGPATGTQDFSDGQTAGVEVDLAAPGMEIDVEGVGSKSGTSMAAPFVAGAAVLVAGAEDPAGRLRETAAPAEQLAAAEAQHGILDIQAALDDVEPDEEQADVMDDTAASRDAGYRAESAARGGIVAQYLF